MMLNLRNTLPFGLAGSYSLKYVIIEVIDV